MSTPDAGEGWFVVIYGAGLLILAATQLMMFRSQHAQEKTMGVVADTLNQIHANLNEGRSELLAQIDGLRAQLEAKGQLDADDQAALAALAQSAQELADIVPNAVVEPLPDPETPPEVGGDEPVVDPDSPVDDLPAEEEPITGDPVAEEPVAEVPVEDVEAGDSTDEDHS